VAKKKRTTNLIRIKERGEYPKVEPVIYVYLPLTGSQMDFLKASAAKAAMTLGTRVTTHSLLRALVQREMDRQRQRDILDE
jgi:hypothetical protein